MFVNIYVQPIYVFVVCTILGLLLWIIMNICYEDSKLIVFVNTSIAIAGVFVILFCTLIGREAGEHYLELTPLISLKKAKIQPEYYRTLLLNTILFIPFGLGLAGVLPKRYSLIRRCLIVIVAGLVLSVGIEATQYIFRLGEAEMDDVLANITGAVVASLALCIEQLIKKTYLALGKRATRRNE